MQVLLLNTSELRYQLNNRKYVEEAQQKYASMLHYYLKCHHPGKHSTLFARGLMLVHDTQRVHELSLQRLKLFWCTIVHSFNMSSLFEIHLNINVFVKLALPELKINRQLGMHGLYWAQCFTFYFDLRGMINNSLYSESQRSSKQKKSLKVMLTYSVLLPQLIDWGLKHFTEDLLRLIKENRLRNAYSWLSC